jgi:mannose-6-phosphate isomerase-like protein (cupin superfamily)
MAMKYVFYKKEVFRSDLENPTRTAYIWVDKEQGAKHVSGGSVDIPAKSELAYHSHEKEEEIMFVYKGRGVAIVEGVSYPVEPETMVFVPPGLKHQFKNTGSESLSIAWFYAPPGPEQGVRIAAKK